MTEPDVEDGDVQVGVERKPRNNFTCLSYRNSMWGVLPRFCRRIIMSDHHRFMSIIVEICVANKKASK